MITISNKTSLHLTLLAATGFIAIAGTGDVKNSGAFKLGFTALGFASFLYAKEQSYTAEERDIEDLKYRERMEAIEDEEFQIEAENHLTAHRVLSEHRIMNQIGSGQTVDVPAQPVALPQVTGAPVAIPAPQTAMAIAPPVSAPVQQIQHAQQVQAMPVQQQPVNLPDGAKLIEASAIADINKYPVVMVVAVPGSGKTLTMNWIVSQLPGKKVLCSHKSEAHHRKMYDLVFGYNPHSDLSRWIGDNSTLTTSDRDFDFIGTHQGGCGTIAQGYWALFADVSKRQQLGPTRASQLPIYRDFYDETSYAYSTAFQDPLNPDQLKWGQSLVGSTNKLVFFDGRSNGHQVYFAAQSDSVDIIGLKGLSEARDEMWFLYPGRAAIAYASQKKKTALSNWLQSRLDQGHAIALLVKQDVYWEVVNLPRVEQMKAWEASFASVPVATQPQQQPGSTIYDLVQQAKDDEEAA